MGFIFAAVFIGGFPTIISGAIGFYFNSTLFDLSFLGLVIGT